jgi:hypothetical protein
LIARKRRKRSAEWIVWDAMMMTSEHLLFMFGDTLMCPVSLYFSFELMMYAWHWLGGVSPRLDDSTTKKMRVRSWLLGMRKGGRLEALGLGVGQSAFAGGFIGMDG